MIVAAIPAAICCKFYELQRKIEVLREISVGNWLPRRNLSGKRHSSL